MSTRRPQPGPNNPHASRNTKVRNAKGAGYNVTSSGYGESAHSFRYKLFVAMAVVIIIIIIFLVMTVTSGVG